MIHSQHCVPRLPCLYWLVVVRDSCCCVPHQTCRVTAYRGAEKSADRSPDYDNRGAREREQLETSPALQARVWGRKLCSCVKWLITISNLLSQQLLSTQTVHYSISWTQEIELKFKIIYLNIRWIGAQSLNIFTCVKKSLKGLTINFLSGLLCSKQFLYLCFSWKYKVKIDVLQWIFNEPVGI